MGRLFFEFSLRHSEKQIILKEYEGGVSAGNSGKFCRHLQDS